MNYKLYYWPAPFRGNFIRFLLEEAGEKYEEASVKEISKLYSLSVEDQPIPMMAPPFLHDRGRDVFLSQMPAIVMYLSEKMGLLPQDSYKSAICNKLVLDSNDVLIEMTNYNGSVTLHHYLAISYGQISDFEKAIDQEKMVIEAKKGESSEDELAKYYYTLGTYYEQAGQKANACDAYKNAVYGDYKANAEYKIKHTLKCQ